MLQKVINFVKYNNAFTIGIMMLFLGAGMSFAASPAIRDGVYSSKDIVTSVDNHEIVSADLDNFNFNLKITSVTEDDKNYYINYSYQTLAVADSIWQQVSQDKTLTVSKESISGKDLGLYVAAELGDNINYELSYLKRVQDLEKNKGESQKVITTEYAGLIGKLLDPKEKIIEGYNPVIPEVIPVVPIVPEPVPDTSPETQYNPSGYIPSLDTTQKKQVDEEVIKTTVEQMLSESQANTGSGTIFTPEPVVPEPTPTPEPEPAVTAPDPDISNTPTGEVSQPENISSSETIPVSNQESVPVDDSVSISTQ